MDIMQHIKFTLTEGLKGSLRRIASKVYEKVGTLSAEFSPSDEPVPFNERMNLNYSKIQNGQIWHKKSFGCAWFHFTGKVPECAKGRDVELVLQLTGEGCLMDFAGNPLKGLSSINSFIDFVQPVRGKRILDFKKNADGGEEVDIWVETGTNRVPGTGPTRAKLRRADIVVVREDIKGLYYDVLALEFQKFVSGKKDLKRKTISDSVSKALSVVGNFAPENVEKARAILKEEMARGEENPFTIYATGHAHLDLAWLWPLRETQRKAGRTFSTQLANLEKYDGYVFGASQPQQFAWMEEKYPALFERIKKAVQEGKIEPQGGMWVECDTNITSGESLIRQNLYGTRYWRDKFGKEVKVCHLPDVFGFSGNLPQILKKSGIDYFETIKLSWNEHNKFPSRTFIWEGIDGSDVIVHMPPDETYNSDGTPITSVTAVKNYPEKENIKDLGMLYGIGDGGGGPSEGHIEMVLRGRHLTGLPKIKVGPQSDLFDALENERQKMSVYKGELYLEKHQGTYTTQSKNKYYNRKLEFALHNAEYLGTLAAIKGIEYPYPQLEKIWKEVLLYQFHDIIPGSSINRVYVESVKRYEEMLEEVEKISSDLIGSIAGKDKVLTAINPTGYRNKGVVLVNDKWYKISVPPYSAAPLEIMEKDPSLDATDETIENEYYLVKFDKNGNINSLFDKRLKRDFGDKHWLNKLHVYPDKRLHYNAWDIDINYTKKIPAEFKLVSHSVKVLSGAVIRENNYKFGNSTISQKVVLYSGGQIIDFITDIDWHEKHKMLRAEFRPSVFSDEVTCDIQMGSIKRSTKDQTKIEKAQFEISAHKWIDVSDNEKDAGFSVLTESKYGWRVKEGLISLNLLRSPVWPDPEADRGKHTIRYALYPHAGDHNSANTQKEAYLYNIKPLISASSIELEPFVLTGNPHVVVETIKRAEDGKGTIIRLYEDAGKETTISLSISQKGEVFETDLLERISGPAEISALKFKPFEIKTLLVK
ncbi:MAG: Mannosylglycerate hydrolase [Firmicutes bacterium ADurb.Bin080]|nr:MAG: Mannosylglycerate hydrolase [Firmicutes bacterium ADurb.Bin080]